MSTDECSSNESGWTMYIASSPEQHSDDNHSEEDDEDNDHALDVDREEGEKHKEEEEEDGREDMDISDDSMASDASSGPSDQRRFSGRVVDRASCCIDGLSNEGSSNEGKTCGGVSSCGKKRRQLVEKKQHGHGKVVQKETKSDEIKAKPSAARSKKK